MRAVGIDERQVMKMIVAEFATYATLGVRCGLHHWFAAEQAAVCVPHCRLFSVCCLVHSTWIAYNHYSIRFACGNRVIPRPCKAHT